MTRRSDQDAAHDPVSRAPEAESGGAEGRLAPAEAPGEDVDDVEADQEAGAEAGSRDANPGVETGEPASNPSETPENRESGGSTDRARNDRTGGSVVHPDRCGPGEGGQNVPDSFSRDTDMADGGGSAGAGGGGDHPRNLDNSSHVGICTTDGAAEIGAAADAADQEDGEGDDRAGVTLSRQAPAASVATVAVDGPASAVWAALANSEAFQTALVEAARDVATGRTALELFDALDDAGVDALHGAYADLIRRTARGDRRAVFDLLRETRRLGRGRSPFEDVLGAARLFELSDAVTPTVDLRVGQDFREVRASARRDVCRLLATLARGCDVRLVATGFLQRWLVDRHRADLPVSREDITTPGEGVLAGRVEAARAALDPEGMAVDVCRRLADRDSETATYGALYSAYAVSKSRVRQVVGELVDLDLVARFDAADGRAVELLPAGRELVDALDAEIGRQQRLEASVSGPGKPSGHGRVTPREHGRGERDRRRREWRTGPVDVEYLGRPHHAAAAGSAVDGGVALVDHPVDRLDDGREPGWSYDAAADRLVVSAEYHNPLQYWVSTARALADWRTFRHVLDADRLGEDVLDEVPLAVLRDARCLGYLDAEAADGEGYAESLADARDHLLDLTRDLANEEYEGRDRFRGEVTKAALGLASTMVHVLDIAGVDVVREVRLPEFSRNYGEDRRRDLVRTVAKGVAIQSRYGEFAAYRQLFEPREGKREAAFSPDVDAADPVGRLAGSFVLVGPGVDAVEVDLLGALRSPGELHEDAPEFAIAVDVEASPGRAAYARTVRAALEAKNIDATREAVSIAEAFAGSPYDVAEALNALGSETVRREARVDELRYALATLPTERLLPDAAPSVSALVRALLATEAPLDVAALAEAADLSTRSVRTHLDRLVAFDLVREAGGGYRLALSTSAERGAETVLPWYARPNRERDDLRDATEKGVIAAVAAGADPPPGDVAAVLGALGGGATLQTPAAVRRAVLDVWPWAGPLLAVARAFAAEEIDCRRGTGRTVAFGPPIEQAPLGTEAGPTDPTDPAAPTATTTPAD